MLEFLAVWFLAKVNAGIAEEKGRSRTVFIVLTIVLWLGFEFLGALIALFSVANRQLTLTVYVYAFVGALVGGLLSFVFAKLTPPAVSKMPKTLPGYGYGPGPGYGPAQGRPAGYSTPGGPSAMQSHAPSQLPPGADSWLSRPRQSTTEPVAGVPLTAGTPYGQSISTITGTSAPQPTAPVTPSAPSAHWSPSFYGSVGSEVEPGMLPVQPAPPAESTPAEIQGRDGDQVV